MKKKGFTLIELMVVTSIIGLLAAIVLPRFTDITSSAKVAQVQGNLANLRTSIGMFHAKTGFYPDLEGEQNNLDNVREGTIAFTDYYSKSTAPETPAYDEVAANNSIINTEIKSTDWDDWDPGDKLPNPPGIDDPWRPGVRLPDRPNPEDPTDPGIPENGFGGWIYNINTGDFFANLPKDAYDESIDWSNY